MPVVIVSKTPYSGTLTLSALNTETTVIEISGLTNDFIVEGYIDLRNLASGDAVVIKEYIAVDGSTYSSFITQSFSGPVSDPVIRFHSKTLLAGMNYKVTINQTAGTLRSFPYAFILQVLGVF